MSKSPQGWVNTTAFFHERLTNVVLKPIRSSRNICLRAIQRVDDALLYGNGSQETLEAMNKLLAQVMNLCLHSSVKKCVSFKSEVEYSGKMKEIKLHERF